MGEFHLLDHPLISHKIGLLRAESTDSKTFRELTTEITTLMAYEVTRDMVLTDKEVTTPLSMATVKKLAEPSVTVVCILRAGLGMLDAYLNLIPSARTGFIGLYRDHMTLMPIDYYINLPGGMDESYVILTDPMLATAGSAVAAVNFLKKQGATRIKFTCLIAAKPGVQTLMQAHPDVEVYAAALDESLNEHGYIIPGLGDAGDRLFDTLV